MRQNSKRLIKRGIRTGLCAANKLRLCKAKFDDSNFIPRPLFKKTAIAPFRRVLFY